jgi:hypothetical protein
MAPAAPVTAPAPAPASRVFDPASGMELVNNAWTWPAEQAAGWVWNGSTWAPPITPAPVAPAPPMPPAPPAPPAF